MGRNMKVSLGVGVVCVLLLGFVSHDAIIPAAAIPSQSQGMSAAEDRQRLLDLLHLPTPSPFPPAADDPNRPQSTFQKGGGTNWYDEGGNTYVRSNWGKWSNYDENNANAPGPVPLIIVVSGGFGGLAAQPIQPKGAGSPTGGVGGIVGGGAMPQVLALGWGYATVNTGAIQADNGAGLTSGIIGLANKGKLRKPDDWGVLAAWSWGMSRALDYFETDKSVDAKQVGLEGHSRWGKEALIAMAFDQRCARLADISEVRPEISQSAISREITAIKGLRIIELTRVAFK